MQTTYRKHAAAHGEILLLFVSIVLVMLSRQTRAADGDLRNIVGIAATMDRQGHLYYPGQSPIVSLVVTNNSEQSLALSGTCFIDQIYGKMASTPGKTDAEFGNYTLPSIPRERQDLASFIIARKSTYTITIKPALRRFGCFIVKVSLRNNNNMVIAPVATFARVYPPVSGFRFESPIILPYPGFTVSPAATRKLDVYKRLGFKWLRVNMMWPDIEPQKGSWTWINYDDLFDYSQKNGFYLDGLAMHSPDWAFVDGKPAQPRPGKIDCTPAPNHMADWQDFFTETTQRYKHLLRSWEVWNEPWEGDGITEYASTGAHYRDMQVAAYKGVKAADPTCLVGSNESEANCQDNLMSVPGMDKYFDIGWQHAYGTDRDDYAPEYYRKMGKKCWDTECWDLEYVDEPELINDVFFSMGRGQSKKDPVTPIWDKCLYDNNDDFGHGPNPVASSISTLLHFIEDTHFVNRVNIKSAPWIWVFAGRDKAVAAVNGRVGVKGVDVWDQQISDGAMTVADPNAWFRAYDRYGEPLPHGKAAFSVPLDKGTYYISTTSAHLAAMNSALAAASISGITPVQITAHDITSPLGQKPPIRVTIRNAYNVPLSGTVTLEAPISITLKSSAQTFKNLAPGRTLDLSFATITATPLPDNHYNVKYSVHTNHGDAEIDEGISTTYFARGTPSLNGNISDWQKLGANVVYLNEQKFTPSSEEQGWFPFKDWSKQTGAGFFAQAAAMWDDNNFYMMAEVHENNYSPHPGPLTGKWYELAPAPYDYTYAKPPQVVYSSSQVQIAFDCIPNVDTLLPPSDPNYRSASFRNTDYEYSLLPTKADGNLVWRSLAPGLPWTDHYPFSPRRPFDQGPVSGAKITVKRDEVSKITTYKAAIPWSEMKDLKPQPGKVVRFSFRVKNGDGAYLEWAHERSIAKLNALSFHPDWSGGYSVETEWGFAK